MQLTIQLSGKAPALIDRVQKRIESDEAVATVEQSAESAWKEHMQENYVGRVNALGGQSTGYYRGAHDSISARSEGKVVKLTMSQIGLRLHYLGGTVRPTGRISSVTGKPIRFLTIPMVPEAHGRTASAFPRLTSKGTQGPGLYDQAGRLIFRFARQATIRPDPNLIPSSEYFGRAIMTGLRRLIADIDPGAAVA